MKAVLMAGGHGTRMRPLLAPPINKHLMPLRGQPLIHWPLQLLAHSGVQDVMVLLNGAHPELIMETIGTGEAWGLKVTYRYTPETHGASVGRHLALAESWVQYESNFLLLLGDSYYCLSSLPELTHAAATHTWIMPADADWDDMRKYASAPGRAGHVQTGAWVFDATLFATLRQLNHLPELRIRHIISQLNSERPLTYTTLPARSFIDCGTPEAIRKIESLVST